MFFFCFVLFFFPEHANSFSVRSDLCAEPHLEAAPVRLQCFTAGHRAACTSWQLNASLLKLLNWVFFFFFFDLETDEVLSFF